MGSNITPSCGINTFSFLNFTRLHVRGAHEGIGAPRIEEDPQPAHKLIRNTPPAAHYISQCNRSWVFSSSVDNSLISFPLGMSLSLNL